jgi:hypothetical protein
MSCNYKKGLVLIVILSIWKDLLITLSTQKVFDLCLD